MVFISGGGGAIIRHGAIIRSFTVNGKIYLLNISQQWVEKLPKKYEDRLLVISCEADQAVVKPAMDLGIPVVSAEFLLTGILRQQVDVDAYPFSIYFGLFYHVFVLN